MRITLLTTWRLINSIGGAEGVFCNLANAMAERGHQMTGICFDVESGKPAFPLDNELKNRLTTPRIIFDKDGQGHWLEVTKRQHEITARLWSPNLYKTVPEWK